MPPNDDSDIDHSGAESDDPQVQGTLEEFQTSLGDLLRRVALLQELARQPGISEIAALVPRVIDGAEFLPNIAGAVRSHVPDPSIDVGYCLAIIARAESADVDFDVEGGGSAPVISADPIRLEALLRVLLQPAKRGARARCRIEKHAHGIRIVCEVEEPARAWRSADLLRLSSALGGRSYVESDGSAWVFIPQRRVEDPPARAN